MRRVTGSGAWRSRKPSSETNVPSPITDSRNEAVAKSGSSSSVCSDARPPTVDSASGRPVSVARRVKTSMWRASSATVTASTCWISRKCGWTWPRKRAGTTSAASSFSTRNVITCTTAASTSSPWSIGAVQSIAVAGSHCAGGRLGVEPGGAIGPDLVAVGRGANARLRSARLRPARRARRGPSRAAGRSRTAPSAAGSASPARTAPTQRARDAVPRSTRTTAGGRRAAAVGRPPAGGPAAGTTPRRPPARSGCVAAHARRRRPAATPASASFTRTWAPPSKPSGAELDDGRARRVVNGGSPRPGSSRRRRRSRAGRRRASSWS